MKQIKNFPKKKVRQSLQIICSGLLYLTGWAAAITLLGYITAFIYDEIKEFKLLIVVYYL
jgi:hypothetical protein